MLCHQRVWDLLLAAIPDAVYDGITAHLHNFLRKKKRPDGWRSGPLYAHPAGGPSDERAR